MKLGKIALIVQFCAMQLVVVFMILAFILLYLPSADAGDLFSALLLALIASILAAVISLGGIAVGIYNIFQKVDSPVKLTLILKLCLMPWYVINFAFWFLVSSGFINPFTFLALPVVIFIAVSLTSIYIVASSAHNISYMIHLYREKKIELDTKNVVIIVFHLISILDIVGCIMLYNETKQLSNNEQKIDIIEEGI